MKKIIINTLLFLAISHFAVAQNTIAKLKFEEAEEAYTNNNLELALTKLKEAETILKATNPRILYLQILTQEKIIAKDTLKDYAIIDNTRKAIDKYLKEYDNIPDNEEKYKDIYKASERFKAVPASLDDFNRIVSGRAKAKQDVVDADALKLKKSQEYILKLAERYGFKPYITLEEFAALSPANKSIAAKKPKVVTNAVGGKNFMRVNSFTFSISTGPYEMQVNENNQLVFLNYIVEKGGVSKQAAVLRDFVEEVKQNIDSKYIKEQKNGNESTGYFTGVEVIVPGTKFYVETVLDRSSFDLHFGGVK